ncbi:MAG TPA: hypothetical protein VGE43_11850 [Acidimicrobiales bacterium]
MTPMDPVTGISLGRIALGIGAIVAPDPTARVLGLDPAVNPQLSYFGRMFGAREIALGAVTLASGGALRRNLTLVGIAVDAADAATGVAEVRARHIGKPSGAMLSGVALGAVVSGVAALVMNRRGS